MDEIGPVAVKSALIIVLRSRFSPLIILQMRLVMLFWYLILGLFAELRMLVQ